MEKKIEEIKDKEELTIQNVPKAVNYLINEIAEMRAVLEHIESQLGLGVDKHRPIDEERAAEILGQTKNVIKKMVRAREIRFCHNRTDPSLRFDELSSCACLQRFLMKFSIILL